MHPCHAPAPGVAACQSGSGGAPRRSHAVVGWGRRAVLRQGGEPSGEPTMVLRDARGEPIAAGGPRSVKRFETALVDVLGFAGDPIGRIEAALADDPDLVLGHLLRADIFLFALQPG